MGIFIILTKPHTPPRNFILVSKLHNDETNLTFIDVFSLYFCNVILFRKTGHINQYKMKTFSTLNSISYNRPPGQLFAYMSRVLNLLLLLSGKTDKSN